MRNRDAATARPLAPNYRYDFPLLGGAIVAGPRAAVSVPPNAAGSNDNRSDRPRGGSETDGRELPGDKPRCTCGCSLDDHMLDTKEAAKYLRVSADYLEKLRSYGIKRGSPPRFS